MVFVVVVTGAAGFIGRAFTGHLLSLGSLTREEWSSPRAIDRLLLLDSVKDIPGVPNDPRVRVAGEIDLRDDSAFAAAVEIAIADAAAGAANAEAAATLATDMTAANISTEADVELSIFHLGGIASGDGERDDDGADLALDVNFGGTRRVLTYVRNRSRRIGRDGGRVVFPSTNAVFAPTSTITDDSKVLPLTSYGCAKAMCELLIHDWSRRNFVDARCTRMPAVVPRTTPNASAASAWSEVIERPCSGQTARLSVPLETSLPIISIFHMMRNIVRLHEVSSATLGTDRTVVMPALAVTLESASAAVAKVLRERGLPLPQPIADYVREKSGAVEKIIAHWPPNHHVRRAYELGWSVDASVEDIAREFLDRRSELP